MSFWKKIIQYRWDGIQAAIRRKTAKDVRQALRAPTRSFDDLLALLSPAAAGFLEEMAIEAPGLTVQRFGRTFQMFAPVYISSECTNSCVY